MAFVQLNNNITTGIDKNEYATTNKAANELRLYWTKSHQVVGILWGDYDKERETCLVSYHTTNGGGYCKEDHILALLFNDLGLKPKGMDMGGAGIPWEFKVGGNFWNVPASSIRKVIRGK